MALIITEFETVTFMMVTAVTRPSWQTNGPLLTAARGLKMKHHLTVQQNVLF